MTEKEFRFALFGNVYQAEKAESIRQVLSALRLAGARIAIERDFLHFLQDRLHLDLTPDEVIHDQVIEADFAISLGGDGTFLNTAARIAGREIPIVGINTGHLGFLAETLPEDAGHVIRALMAGHYGIERRHVLQLTTDIPAGTALYPCALNEIAVLKHDHSSMIAIETSIDGNYLATYQADGLIVSTPTGSTAYSLSVGGPIIDPCVGAIVLTPVAAHSLNMRPIVVSDNTVVRLHVKSRNHSYLVSLDGRSRSLPDNVSLEIRRAPHDVLVVHRQDTTFYDTLRNKLMWGARSQDMNN